MDTEKTGRMIAELRREKGLKQAELAQLLHVSDKAVSRWETGRGFPDIDTLEPLAQQLGVSVAELLKGEKLPDPVPREETGALLKEGLQLAGRVFRRKQFIDLAAGFFLSLILVTAAVVHMTSPAYIRDPENAVTIEQLSDGQIVALLSEDVSGYELSKVGENEYFISCYKTRLSQLTGKKNHDVVLIGTKDTVKSVWYYPSSKTDRLIWGESRDGGVETLPRLIYNMWFVLGAACTAVFLGLYLLLRKKHYSPWLWRAFLLSGSFTFSIIICLWGKWDEVYNALFYFSGIVLVTAALFAALVLLFPGKRFGQDISREIKH